MTDDERPNMIVKHSKKIKALSEQMQDRRLMTYDEYQAKYGSFKLSETDPVDELIACLRGVVQRIFGKRK